MQNLTAEEGSFDWSHHRISSTDSKVRITVPERSSLNAWNAKENAFPKPSTLHSIGVFFVFHFAFHLHSISVT